MKLPRLKRGVVPAASDRRRRTPRPDGPRTIIPGDDRPSWLPADAPVPAADPLQARLDAARERLRRDIPPVSDEDL